MITNRQTDRLFRGPQYHVSSKPAGAAGQPLIDRVAETTEVAKTSTKFQEISSAVGGGKSRWLRTRRALPRPTISFAHSLPSTGYLASERMLLS